MRKGLFLLFLSIIIIPQIYFYFPNKTGIQDRWMVSAFFIDEHAQLMNFEEMFKGNTAKSVLKYGYYYYGFPFFLLNYLVYLPFYLWKGINIPLLMLLMRQLSVLFGSFVLILLFIIAKKITSSFFALLYILFIFFMPAFQRSLLWWHPDAMVISLLILGLYFLLRDNFSLGKSFLIAWIFLSISTAIKYIGILFTPTVFLYVFTRKLCKKTTRRSGFIIKLGKAFLSGIVSTIGYLLLNSLIFVSLNPLFVLPKYRKEYFGEFMENYFKNQFTISLSESKDTRLWLNALNGNYFSSVFLIFIIIGLFILILKKGKVGLILLYFTVPYLIYLVMSVSRAYSHYLLITVPIFSFGMIYLIFFLSKKDYLLLSLRALFLGLTVVIFINQLLNNYIVAGRNYAISLKREENAVIKIGKELLSYTETHPKYRYKNIKIIKNAYTYVPERNNWYVQNVTAGVTQQFVDELRPDFIVILKSNLINIQSEYKSIEQTKNPEQKKLLQELYKLKEPYFFYQKVINNTLAEYKKLMENEEVLILELLDI